MTSQKPKKAAILLNLGTPDSPRPSDVRKYLREFLMDPYVIDIPYLARFLLVYGLILPTRPKKSAEAYQKIWTPKGSPLLFHLSDLTEKVQNLLGASWLVRPAMRYGSPSIESTFEEFQDLGLEEVTLLPLYPQYSLAATESSIQECLRVSKKIIPHVRLRFVEPFYRDEGFIQSFAEVARENLKDYSFDHLLFSYHGLPERQVKKTDSSGTHCLSRKECCDEINPSNQKCYRAHCFVTTQKLVRELKLEPHQYSICFQSRLGRTPWIKPFTDELLQELPKKGVKRLAVICPAFVSDCLETLEEIQIRGREDFLRYGGEDLKLIPSLNSSDVWANAVKQLILGSIG